MRLSVTSKSLEQERTQLTAGAENLPKWLENSEGVSCG